MNGIFFLVTKKYLAFVSLIHLLKYALSSEFNKFHIKLKKTTVAFQVRYKMKREILSIIL